MLQIAPQDDEKVARSKVVGYLRAGAATNACGLSAVHAAKGTNHPCPPRNIKRQAMDVPPPLPAASDALAAHSWKRQANYADLKKERSRERLAVKGNVWLDCRLALVAPRHPSIGNGCNAEAGGVAPFERGLQGEGWVVL